MKYALNKVNHYDFKTMEIGRLAPRAYAIPHSKKDAAINAEQSCALPTELSRMVHLQGLEPWTH